MGFVNEVTTLGAFEDTVARWCEQILLCAPLSIAASKEAIMQGLDEPSLEAAMANQDEVALEKLYDYCDTPKRAVDVFPALFKSEINDSSYFPATGEAIAHLHCALERRILTVEEDKEGVAWWCQA